MSNEGWEPVVPNTLGVEVRRAPGDELWRWRIVNETPPRPMRDVKGRVIGVVGPAEGAARERH